MTETVTPAPASKMTVTAEEHNAVFDPANDALGGAFKDGFREGWLFAKDPGFEDREELEAEYQRAVDIAPSECWDAYRSHYFSMLPLATIPDVGETATAPAPQLRVYPQVLTDDLRDILSMMMWDSGPIAHALRDGGQDIKRKAEDEQAEVLHWLIGLALEHGSEWRSKASDRICEIRASLVTSEGSDA